MSLLPGPQTPLELASDDGILQHGIGIPRHSFFAGNFLRVIAIFALVDFLAMMMMMMIQRS